MKFQEQFWPTEDLDKWFKDKKIVSQMSVFSEKGVFSRKYMEKKFYDEWHKPQRNIFSFTQLKIKNRRIMIWKGEWK